MFDAKRRLLRGCGCCDEQAGLSRRGFLASAVGAAAVSALTPGAALAQTAAKPARIDVHHHMVPPAHAEFLARKNAPAIKWSVQMSLDDMDKSGIKTALLSQIQPGTWFGDADESRKMSRVINEYGAKLVQDHPGRFGLFATITPLDVEGSLKEIEYAFDTLKADGLGLLTSYNEKYLGDPSFAPVWQELNRRKAVIYVHPLAANCCGDVVPGIPAGSIEYATDSTRTIAHLVFTGTSQKFPDIRWIFSHAGGTLPFLTQRFIQQQKVQKHAFLPNGPMPEFKKFYYELAQGNTKAQLFGLSQIIDSSHMLYGTDFPYRDGAEINAGIAEYNFTAGDLAAIDRGTAMTLLPNLKG
jgi:predicted TIM-barrel fold metal-dependent hydrolase